MSKTPEAFMNYYRTNYPGPTTISNPDWHAPKIYAAALAASGHAELLAACKEALPIVQSYNATLSTVDVLEAAIKKAEAES